MALKPIVCMGELLIDFVALERDTSVGYANQFEKAAGGAPANVAVGIARLGLPSAFITQLGNDPFGHYLNDVLAENNVNTDGVTFTDDANTALAFAAVEASGERSFAFYRNPSADMLMTSDQLEQSLLANCPIFHFGSITLIDDPVKQTTLDAIKQAREHGAVISYDPNLREVLWPSLEDAKTGMLLGLAEANIVKLNDDELAFLQELDDIDDTDAMVSAARNLWHDHLQLMVITRGSRGCLAVSEDHYWESDGFIVEVEDTIGAGDGFMAGIISGVTAHLAEENVLADILTDKAIPPILRLANAVGALTASQRGAIPALPTTTAVDAFLSAID